MKNIFKNPDLIWKWLFFAVAAIGLVAIIKLGLGAGNSGDEHFHYEQATYVYDYYKSFGKDTTAVTVTEKYNLPYYGQSVDNLAFFIAKAVGMEDDFTIRHIVCCFFGWLGMLFAALAAYLIGGWRAAFFTFTLIFFSPRFLGHSFNNLKDLPFASIVMAGIYGILLFFKQFPKVKWYTYLILILSIAMAISVRVGGFILIGYFGLFGLTYLIKMLVETHKAQKVELSVAKSNAKKIQRKQTRKKDASNHFGKAFLRMLLMGAGICLAGFFVGLLLWPYALVSPIKHTMEAFGAMSNFESFIRQLFEGTFIYSDALPWYYLPKLILLTTPIAVFIGAILYFFFGMFKKENWFYAGALWFAFLFPIVWIIYTDANVYCGWRHVLFAYTPLTVLAGLGFDGLIRFGEKLLKPKVAEVSATEVPEDTVETKRDTKSQVVKVALNVAGFALVGCLLINPIRHTIVNHPYEYVFFNKAFGGMENAYGNYELDYYYHTTRAACEWLQANAEAPVVVEGDSLYKPNPKIQVATWHQPSVAYFLRKDTARFSVKFSRWDKLSESDWDYGIYPITGIDPTELKNKKSFPPVNCVHTIEVDGYPICFIVRHENKSDLMAFLSNKELMQYRRLDERGYQMVARSQKYLAEAYAYNPYNRSMLTTYMELYEALGNTDSIMKYANLKLQCLPKDEIATFYKALCYQKKGDEEMAVKTYRHCIKLNCKYSAAYAGLGDIYKSRKDWKSYENLLMKEIDENIFNAIRDDNVELINIYKQQGMSEPYAYKRAYKTIAERYQAAGNTEGYRIYWEVYEKIANQLK